MNCSVGPSIGLALAVRRRRAQPADLVIAKKRVEKLRIGVVVRDADACRYSARPIHRVETLDAVALELAVVEAVENAQRQ